MGTWKRDSPLLTLYERRVRNARQQHVHLETHTSISYLTEDGRLHLRTSTQTPFLTKAKLAFPPRFVSENKCTFLANGSEMLCEDLCAFATLDLRRPVKWEFTRSNSLLVRPPLQDASEAWREKGRHSDRYLFASCFSNTGAYGNHGGDPWPFAQRIDRSLPLP